METVVTCILVWVNCIILTFLLKYFYLMASTIKYTTGVYSIAFARLMVIILFAPVTAINNLIDFIFELIRIGWFKKLWFKRFGLKGLWEKEVFSLEYYKD